METQFPSLPQILTSFCFLSPLEEHQRILVDLNASVVFHRMPGRQLPTPEQLKEFLVEKYGGAAQNWSFTTITRGFLIRVPDWVSPDDLIFDTKHWETQRGVHVVLWQAVESSSPLPVQNRVLVTITDFPLDFWHPQYFHQATVFMGKLAGYVRVRENGENKSTLRLLLDCHDLNLVPYHLIVGHNEVWTQCEVHLEGRE